MDRAALEPHARGLFFELNTGNDSAYKWLVQERFGATAEECIEIVGAAVEQNDLEKIAKLRERLEVLQAVLDGSTFDIVRRVNIKSCLHQIAVSLGVTPV